MQHNRTAALRRFARSPKGQLLGYLALLIMVAIPGQPATRLALEMPAAVLAAGLLDLTLARLRWRRWSVPTGAALTALLCTLVIAPQAAWYIPVAAASIGIMSKHLIRVRWAHRHIHVLNPAVAGLLATLLIFPAGQSWWGALPQRPGIWILALLAIGVLLDNRVNKLPQVLAYLATYYGLFTTLAIGSMGGGIFGLRLADVYRVPFVNVTLFVALLMLTDPPTSPNTQDEQLRFGALAGAAAFITYLAIHSLAYPLVGLLVANTALAWQRRRQPTRAPVASGCPAQAPAVAQPTAPQLSTSPNRSVSQSRSHT